jgi:hypothetical protein
MRIRMLESVRFKRRWSFADCGCIALRLLRPARSLIKLVVEKNINVIRLNNGLLCFFVLQISFTFWQQVKRRLVSESKRECPGAGRR